MILYMNREEILKIFRNFSKMKLKVVELGSNIRNVERRRQVSDRHEAL